MGSWESSLLEHAMPSARRGMSSAPNPLVYGDDLRGRPGATTPRIRVLPENGSAPGAGYMTSPTIGGAVPVTTCFRAIIRGRPDATRPRWSDVESAVHRCRSEQGGHDGDTGVPRRQRRPAHRQGSPYR